MLVLYLFLKTTFFANGRRSDRKPLIAMNIESEKQALKISYSLKSSEDKILGQRLDKNKLTDWQDFEIGSETDCIYIPPEFQDNSYLINAISQKWLIARKWLIKEEWNSKTVVHPIKQVRDAHKPIGDLLICYWQLAERCYSYQESSGIDLKTFTNVGRLFSRIFVEIVAMDLANAFYPPENNYYNNRKMGWLEIERKRLRQLKNHKNPFNKESQTFGLKMLIDCAINLASYSDRFKEKFWKIYLDKYVQYIQQLNKPEWGRLYVEKSKYYIQSGQGRGGTGRTFIGTVEDHKNFVFRTLTE